MTSPKVVTSSTDGVSINATVAENVLPEWFLSPCAADARDVQAFVIVVDGGGTPSPVGRLVEDAPGGGGRKKNRPIVESQKFGSMSEQGLSSSMAL